MHQDGSFIQHCIDKRIDSFQIAQDVCMNCVIHRDSTVAKVLWVIAWNMHRAIDNGDDLGFEKRIKGSFASSRFRSQVKLMTSGQL
mmetsp:Transcript_130349/g.377099  ORF Transcript_130349/g.377099 Transcript_130349/m.377099 type:complete len:86 (+) Transcript_130349:281-538(+)